MPLANGTRFGSLEIIGPLGAGGMGEVYRARDPKLNRDVAIKIIPETLAADPAALARFQTEAQAVAALSHPNILSIFDLGAERGMPYAVMELLDGATLRELVDRGPLAQRKAIEYAVQISAGLAAAHARGITHRDLKPENVFVTDDGRVKILDFGLAKVGLAAAAGSGSVQATINPTTPGTVLGTVGYMSPEQVRGQAVDQRSDIFALGAILYEMLSGRRAFAGPSAVETMNAILKDDPPEIMRTNAALPPALDRIVRRCLEKHPDERFQSARDLGFALEALSGSQTSVHASAPPPRRTTRWLMPLASLVLVGAAIAAGIGIGRSTGAATAADRREITFETKTFDPQAIFNARFMPDGQTIVFSTALEGNTPALWVSRPGQIAPQAIGARGVHLLSVSSKGELAVLTDAAYIGHRLFTGTLARLPIDGAPRPWLENVREADWSPDGSTLAVVRDQGLIDRLEYPIGKTLHESSGYLSDVRVSPDGARVAFLEHPARFDDRGWVKVVEGSGGVRTLAGEYWGIEGLSWTPDGSTLIYSSAAAGLEGYQIHAVAASASSNARAAFPSLGSLFVLDINRDGRWLVTSNNDHISIRAKLPGRSEEQEFSWLGNALRPHLSNDGQLLLFTDQSQSAGTNYAVSIRKTDGSAVVRLGEGAGMALSPDGKRVLVTLFNPPSTVIYPVGAGDPITLKTGTLERSRAVQFFPDGQRVIVCGNEPSRPFRCYEQDLAGGAPKPLTPEGLNVGPLAPDGRTIVAIGQDQSKQLLSLPGGEPRPAAGVKSNDDVLAWSGDGRTLFVQKQGAVPALLERVDLATGRRTPVRELAPPDRAGLVAVFMTTIVNDAQAYAYAYWKRVSKLFVVKGASPR
jgi:Tol biopolymer transport system component